jgi:transcriptional regulator with XRE-family HTH domain
MGRRTRNWIASRVAALRVERGWTQKEAADRAGMSLSEYKRVEQATRNTSADKLDKVLTAFGIDIETFTKLELPEHKGRRGRPRAA